MSLLNLGGPGWFNDVFEVEVLVDSAQRVKCRSLLLQDDCPVYSTLGRVTGKIKVTSPDSRSVWHYGVSLHLERSTAFYDSMRTTEDVITTIQVAEGEYVSGDKEYVFDIDLSSLNLADSYDGEMFSIRYGLNATVTRPWYTFDVTRFAPIAIHLVSPAPEDGKFVPPEDASGAGPPPELVVPKDPSITVADCGGTVTFDYGKECYNIGDTLKGQISLVGVPRLVNLVKVVFYKIEMGDEDQNEGIIREVDVMTPKDEIPPPPPLEGEDGDETPPPLPPKPIASDDPETDAVDPPTPPEKPDDIKPKDRTFEVECLLSDSPEVSVGPTYENLVSGDESVSVHYYIRLVLGDNEGNKFWNTHEIVMYRAGFSNVTDVDV